MILILTNHTRTAQLVDKMLAYPAPATFRGSSCPPHPFGQTLTHAVPLPDPRLAPPAEGQPDLRPLVYRIEDAIAQQVATTPRLTALERTELQAIITSGVAFGTSLP